MSECHVGDAGYVLHVEPAQAQGLLLVLGCEGGGHGAAQAALAEARQCIEALLGVETLQRHAKQAHAAGGGALGGALRKALRYAGGTLDNLLCGTGLGAHARAAAPLMAAPALRSAPRIRAAPREAVRKAHARLKALAERAGVRHVALLGQGGAFLAATREWWELGGDAGAPSEAALLQRLLCAIPGDASARDVPVYLPHTAPRAPLRLLHVKLAQGLELAALAGPAPSLEDFRKAALAELGGGKWDYAALLPGADDTKPAEQAAEQCYVARVGACVVESSGAGGEGADELWAFVERAVAFGEAGEVDAKMAGTSVRIFMSPACGVVEDGGGVAFVIGADGAGGVAEAGAAALASARAAAAAARGEDDSLA